MSGIDSGRDSRIAGSATCACPNLIRAGVSFGIASNLTAVEVSTLRLSRCLVPTNLRFGLNNIVPKDEPEFSHCARLVLVHAVATESVPWRDSTGMNISEVSTNEEAAALESGCHCDRCGSAARAVQQIDSLVRGAPGTRDIFPAHWQREPVLKGVTRQHRAARRGCALHDADLLVGGHIGVLKVGL